MSEEKEHVTAMPMENHSDTGVQTQEVTPDANTQVQDPRAYRSLEGSWNNAVHATNQYFKDLRYNTVRFLPGFVVNNSSNLLGIHHVWTEGIMFKASLKGSKLVDHADNPVDYLFKASKRIYGEALHEAIKSRGTGPSIFKGNPIKNIYKFVTDTEAATQREIKTQGVAPTKVQLGNPWQTRSTFVNLVGWTFVSIVPEKKETDEEIERMEIMRKTNPVSYIGTRLGQAFWVPEWMTHKRQVIGITQMAAGVCSMLGAWRNRTRPTAPEMAMGKLPKYVFNFPYFGTGVCSFLAGTSLSFAPDNQTGYREYGNWVMGMTAFLPFSLGEKFRQREPGVGWYTTGKLSFQANAWAQSLFGGAEKKPDGTVIDHEELRREAGKKAEHIKEARKAAKLNEEQYVTHGSHSHDEVAKPAVQISQATSPGRVVETSKLQSAGM